MRTQRTTQRSRHTQGSRHTRRRHDTRDTRRGKALVAGAVVTATVLFGSACSSRATIPVAVDGPGEPAAEQPDTAEAASATTPGTGEQPPAPASAEPVGPHDGEQTPAPASAEPVEAHDGEQTPAPASDNAEPAGAPEVVPDVTPPPTPAPAAGIDNSPCRATAGTRFDVVDVAVDDPDGGLVVHESMGVDAPVVGVFPWNTRDIFWVGECDFTVNGSEWWYVSAPVATGWVNARYLGERRNPGDPIADTPCVFDRNPDAVEAPLPVGVVDHRVSDEPSPVSVASIKAETSADCDRVVIEFGAGWDYDVVPAPLSAFPEDLIVGIERTDSELQIRLHPDVVAAFESRVPGALWRDAATGEENVALVLDRPDGTNGEGDHATWIYVGWGSGTSHVEFATDPPRVIIDIAQTPTPDGSLAGPITAGSPFGPILFDPISPTLHDPDGISGPIRVRGFSYGFEGSSTMYLQRWGHTADEHPAAWHGKLFGQTTAWEDRAPLPDGVSISPPLPDWAAPLSTITAFSTSGYFDYEIAGLPPGGWQIAIEPSSGLGCASAVGQQFRVAGGNPSQASTLPFSLTRSDVVELPEDPWLAATTTTTVLDTHWVTSGSC